MKILCIIGSGRKRGNTARAVKILLAEIEQAAREQGRQAELELETVFLSDLDMRPCRGCRACYDRGEQRCPNHDDLPALREKMRAADGLIVASPVYVDDVSGLTKTWIDRLAHACHRPEFAGKYALALATTGGSPAGRTLRTITLALGTWGYHLVASESFFGGALLTQDELALKHAARLKRTARRFYQAIARGMAARPSFFSLMMFRIQQNAWSQADPGSIDYQHWLERGWLTKSVDFYFPHRAPRIKALLAGWVAAVIVRFVT